jgi:hypothetical protein
MEKDKILEQLVAIVAELRELCTILRQNAVLTKTNGLLLKRHTARMNALLCHACRIFFSYRCRICHTWAPGHRVDFQDLYILRLVVHSELNTPGPQQYRPDPILTFRKAVIFAFRDVCV